MASRCKAALSKPGLEIWTEEYLTPSNIWRRVLKDAVCIQSFVGVRLRARDHYTSITLIGGKGGAGPSLLLHTTLEGPTEYVVQYGCKVHIYGFLHGIEWITFHSHLDCF
jgi:hypothetical protein